MSYEFIELLNDKAIVGKLTFDLFFVLARLSTILMPISVAWFCAGNKRGG
jgi:hypothetical protein